MIPPLVRIYVITYRRPHLLERALRSLVTQTQSHWCAEVLNDDPSDERVAAVLNRIGDARIQLTTPAIHRGGTANFNYAFRTIEEPYASILEDDNWWEPGFLNTMMMALQSYPNMQLACGNEIIWKENADGTWTNTKCTIWPASNEVRVYEQRVLDKCGGAKICNSSMLFKTGNCGAWQTPDSIPIDVTEHYRERVIPHPIALVHDPLVNYGDTLHTHRSTGPWWGMHQVLLIGSVFVCVPPKFRAQLVRALWQRARSRETLLKTTLCWTGLAVKEARGLWQVASASERLRFFLHAAKNPRNLKQMLAATTILPEAWRFLQQGPFADALHQGLICNLGEPFPAHSQTALV
jgi:hypothetical protein